jgi:4-carboxymuconolactone decarboxylase
MAPLEAGSRPELAELEAEIRRTRGRISALYGVLLNSAPLARGWEKLLTAIRQQTTVPPRLRELAILRVAYLNHAKYEFDAHVSHAREAGISDAAIESLRIGGLEGLGELERLVAEYTDMMTRHVEVPDELFERVAAHFDARTLLELTATVAAYNMVSRVLVALHIGEGVP